MACYVDSVRAYPGAGLRFHEFCHLLADSREELHAMADSIGMPRRFFQDHPWRWHYDLPRHLRVLAVNRGAHEVTLPQVGALLRQRRQSLPNRQSVATQQGVANQQSMANRQSVATQQGVAGRAGAASPQFLRNQHVLRSQEDRPSA